MRNCIMIQACRKCRRCGQAACVRRWAVLVARRDETFKYIPFWIARSRDPLSTNLPPPGRPCALGFAFVFKKKVNVFTSSIHRLDLVYRLVALKFTPFFCNVPPTHRPTPLEERRNDSERQAARWPLRTAGPQLCNKPRTEARSAAEQDEAASGALMATEISGLKRFVFTKKSETRAIIEQRGGRIWRDYSQ